MSQNLEDYFFIHKSESYASVRSELCAAIRGAYDIERGTVCGVRWKRKGESAYGPWRIQAYWHEQGGLRSRVLGELEEVWKEISQHSDIHDPPMPNSRQEQPQTQHNRPKVIMPTAKSNSP